MKSYTLDGASDGGERSLGLATGQPQRRSPREPTPEVYQALIALKAAGFPNSKDYRGSIFQLFLDVLGDFGIRKLTQTSP